MNILFIEDCESLGKLVKKYLEMEDMNVTWVLDRRDIPKSFKGFDLILSDYHVPGGDFEETKKMANDQGVPIILASSVCDGDEINPHFVPKPYNFSNLFEIINKLTEKEDQCQAS